MTKLGETPFKATTFAASDGEALPSIDLSYDDDLAGGEQRPEQHGGGFGAGRPDDIERAGDRCMSSVVDGRPNPVFETKR